MQKQQGLKIAKFVIRWGIAVLGIYYVISRMSWHDRVLAILPGQTVPRSLALAEKGAGENQLQYNVIDRSGAFVTVPHDQVVNEPDRAKLTVNFEGRQQYVVGVDLQPDMEHANRILLADAPTGPTAHWEPAEHVPDYHIAVPHPRVQIGVIRMLHEADPRFLLAALLVFPITILITSYRWHELLKALDIHLSLARIFVLNMVGLFYNTFMPGSTGGDLLKAYYVAKQTHHRTRAVMSVLVDRVIGLIALIILGGTMAAFQWQIQKCRQVAVGAGALMVCVIGGLALFYQPTLRRISGLDFFMSKLPMQKQLQKAIEAMEIYGRRPLLALGALLISFPVHMVVILSAMLCGFAFGLRINPFYYWMAVPVIVLAGSIPISPQGAGVMEYFAINLLEPQGVTVGQAFALTMSIRLTQIFWNLSGGYFVLRGGYHAPTQTEQNEVESEDEDRPKGKAAGQPTSVS
ncbi:MAG: flippase-like domain-containing protein [Planctomycetota bacterium]|nr:flippase-like domain-containing protein [Planctomycetota bacterium]